MSELPMTTCCGGTGYADYAAVPCPAPGCLAAAELIRRGPTSIPADQAWFWTTEWQAGERRASAEVAAGGLTVYGSAEELLAALQATPDEETP